MGFKRRQQGRDALDQAIVNDSFVFERCDVLFSLLSFLVDLGLLRPDKRSLVNIGMDFDIRIVAKFQRVLFVFNQQLIPITNEDKFPSIPICYSRQA